MFKKFLENHTLSEFHFRSDFFPTVENRDFWDNFQNNTCIFDAEKEMDYTWPIIKATDFMEFKKSGNRVIMEKIHFDRRKHLVLFALAELKENKGRFLPHLVNGLFTICEESYWGISAHYIKHSKNIPSPQYPYIDLFAAETAEHLAMVITLLRAPLLGFCPEIVDRVEYEIDRRIKTPYESRYDFWWMGYNGVHVNNWNPWILSNLLAVFLLTEPNPRRTQQAIEKMFKEVQYYYDSLPEDGGCDEGPDYWGRAGASLFEFLYLLKCSTKGELDLFDDRKICLVADYMKKVHVTADIFINVADANNRGKSSLLILLYGFAREIGQKELMNFSVAAYRNRTATEISFPNSQGTIRRLIYISEFLREMDAFDVTYPIHGVLEYLPNLELAVLRNGGWILAAKGGFNDESHNHNDVGSFALYDGDMPILVDIGISTYTRLTFDQSTRYTEIPWTRGAYHNIPMINGAEQIAGKKYRSDAFEATERRICVRYPNAYPKEALIHGLERSFELTEKALLIKDTFDFADSKKQAVTEVLMSVLPSTVIGNSVVIDGRYKISANVGNFTCERIAFEDGNLERSWKTDACFRIMLECNGETEISMKVEKI